MSQPLANLQKKCVALRLKARLNQPYVREVESYATSPFKENFHSPFIKYVRSTYHGRALGKALERQW